MIIALMLFAGWPLALVLAGYLVVEMSRRINAEEELICLRAKSVSLSRNMH